MAKNIPPLIAYCLEQGSKEEKGRKKEREGNCEIEQKLLFLLLLSSEQLVMLP